ncbi:hypothetical protein FJ365_02530 [Candidatus Dependentiae bacterium]|nr:hypothetical protein [Candidatus Dependentiae bacterium]
MVRALFLSLFLVIAVPRLQADYLIVKKVAGADGRTALQAVGLDNTTVDQQNKLYQIMMTYEWPMSSVSYAVGNISPLEADALFADRASAEQDFIRAKIQDAPQLGADFDLIFVPKTLYELCALNYLFNMPAQDFAYLLAYFIELHYLQNGKIHSAKASCYDVQAAFLAGLDIKGVSDPVEDTFWSSLDAVAVFIQKRFPGMACRKTTLQQLIFLINQSMGACLLSVGLDDPTVVQQQIKETGSTHVETLLKNITSQVPLLHPVISNLSFSRDDEARFFCSMEFKYIFNRLLLDEQKFLLSMMSAEYDLHAHNHGFLVRGASLSSHLEGGLLDAVSSLCNAVDFDSRPSAHSLSYGNSLFAGSIRDKGACTCNYVLGSCDCYVLKVNKKKFVLKDSCSQLLFISPMPTLMALFGRGEVFHSRTRLYAQPGELKRGIAALGRTVVENPSYLYSIGDKFEQELLFQTYFAEHACFIKSAGDPAAYLTAARQAAEKAKKAIEPASPLKRVRCSADFE